MQRKRKHGKLTDGIGLSKDVGGEMG